MILLTHSSETRLELAIDQQTQALLFYVTFMVMMVFFFVCSALMEKYKPPFGHETTYTILFGVVFSVILYFATPNAQ